MPGDGLGFTILGPRRGVFSWVAPALAEPRTLKTWFRCIVVAAAINIFLVDDASLNNMGQVIFFAGIVYNFVPPAIPLSLFMVASITILIGMLLAWAWGAAMMAAGHHIRNQARLARQMHNFQASVVPNIPEAIQLKHFIYHGGFLDPRTTAIYAVFVFFGGLALGAIRAHIPKLSLLTIFGTILFDIIAVNGALFPTSEYVTFAKLFLKPTAVYIAIAIASLVLIFPESLNHVWLKTICAGILQPISRILANQSTALTSHATDKEKWAEIADQSYAQRHALLNGARELLDQVRITDIELSIGRLGPEDLKRVTRELKLLTFRAANLYAFPIFVKNVHASLSEYAKPTSAEPGEEETLHEAAAAAAAAAATAVVADDELLIPQRGRDFHLTRTASTTFSTQSRDRYALLQAVAARLEHENSHDLDTLLPILAEASQEVREACESAMKAVIEWFQMCNSERTWVMWLWMLGMKKPNGREGDIKVELEKLRRAMKTWKEEGRGRLVRPFERFFDAEGHLKENKDGERGFTARSLFVCYVFAFSIDAFAQRLEKFLELLVELNETRARPRVWAPTGLRKLGRLLLSRGPLDKKVAPLHNNSMSDLRAFPERGGEEEEEEWGGDDNEGEEEEKEAKGTDSKKDIQRAGKNPDILPPTSVPGQVFARIGAAVAWLKTGEGMFSLRHALVSVALWAPAVAKSTTWLYYREKGIWALIMAQTALAVYAGDQIGLFLFRLSGTLVGLLIAIAVWYAAAHGDSRGNPYGMVVALTFVLALFILGRIMAPPVQGQFWVMGGVTIVLVVGTSWVDNHFPVLVDAGVGAIVGWKRALLVIIGFTGGFIVMMLPRPLSTRTLVRHTLAATAGELGYILAVEVDELLAEEARVREVMLESSDVCERRKQMRKEKRARQIVQRAFIVAARLQSLDSSLVTARLEPLLVGRWPHKAYYRLYDIQIKLLSALLLFTGGFMQLDDEWCENLVHQTPFLNPNLLSDIFSNISILSYALAGAHPLPPSLPKLRDRLVYHERLAAQTLHPLAAKDGQIPIRTSMQEEVATLSDRPVSSNFEPENIGDRMGLKELTLDILKHEQLPAHSTALFALSNAIVLVDEMTDIVRELCGEVTFERIDALHNEYLGQEEKTFGGKYAQNMRFR